MIPVLMSGGSGKRLWPISRTYYPKQFSTELFDEPLLISTARRLESFGAPLVITNKNFRALTEKTFDRYRISLRDAIYEPVSRNTAPAVALLTHYLEEKNLLHETIGIFPCDHLVTDETAWRHAIERANALAKEKDQIVVLGIQPTWPATGYGYIATSPKDLESDVRSVERFEEKPSPARAQILVDSKTCFWNSGVIIARGSTLRDLFLRLQPALWQRLQTESLLAFEKLPDLSFDVGILEKLSGENLACVPCHPGWSDVGSWDSYVNDTAGRSHLRAPAVGVESKNVSILSALSKTYVSIGVEDVTLVDTQDACLILKKGESEKLKNAVPEIARVNPPVVDHVVHDVRPWGNYSVLQETRATKVKCVRVDSGARLSYQSHQKREEHWIVTRGSGVVILDEKEYPVRAGSYIHIATGVKHRIANFGEDILEFVEVQMGSYLGEDDIARFQDDYVRDSPGGTRP